MSVFGFLIGTASVAAPAAHSDLRGHFTNADRIARLLTAQASPQDFIIVAPWFCGISFSRYFHGPATWETLPPLADHSTHRYDLVLKEMQATNPLAPIFQKITTTLQFGHRVWLIGLEIPQPGNAPGENLPPPPLKGSGWSDTPYFENWVAQTVWFLDQHSLQYAQRDDEQDSSVYFEEHLQIFSAEGWKNSTPP